MEHTCADCDHVFSTGDGQNEPHVTPAVQCPRCHSYRTQPAGIPDEANDMVHGFGAMPTSTQDDMSGNPLQEGILADGGWKNRQVRDESFASVRKGAIYSLFESPEFETTQIVAPADLYRHGVEAESAHRATLQLPKGITDNLHAALGNLQAWVENPYENNELRPYNKYWKAIRPKRMQPGALRIGVADPTMAEIINHVAQTDDVTPLYEYRGKTAATRTAGPLAALPELAAGAAGAAGADAAAGAGAAEAAGAAGDAAAGAGAGAGADAGAPAVGGVMNRVMNGAQTGAGFQIGKGLINSVDDVLGGGAAGQPGGAGGGGGQANDNSFYARTASDEDDASPDSHDEIPKNKDGDSQVKDDGNSHEWQRDLSVTDGSGALHSPSFDPGGPGLQKFKMLAPLLLQYLDSGEDGSQDPLIQGLHQALEAELPGYLDHADDHAAEKLIVMLRPGGDSEGEPASPEKAEPTHADENAGGKHEAKFASITGEAEGEFLPDLTPLPPSLRGAALYPHAPTDIPTGTVSGPASPEEEMLDSSNWPQGGQPERCPHCGHYGPVNLGLCGGCHREIYPHGEGQAQAMEYAAKTADTQGPQTPEQIKAVQQYLLEHGAELNLRGEELLQTILSVPTNPLEFADVLAKVQGAQAPPAPPQDAGMSATPPMPAQESAPPGATMPVPGMEQQMMSAVNRYSADSIAGPCPKCGSHTTATLNSDGDCRCHACNNTFKTKGLIKVDTTSTSSAGTTYWPNQANTTSNAQFTFTAAGEMPSAVEDPPPAHGVPMADQHRPEDLREEQDSGHTWADEDGNPLKVGQEYELYSKKFDIPDLVRIEAVKPNAVVYTLTGEYGMGHSTELTKEEADLEGDSFRATQQDGEVGPDGSLEENDDDHTGFTGSPEQTDLSAPSHFRSHTQDPITADLANSGVSQQRNPKLAWLTKGAGANFTAMEQRELIDEPGDARNRSALSLDGTHYVSDDADEFLFGI